MRRGQRPFGNRSSQYKHSQQLFLLMSRQDKATTDRFTKTLRELVKRPENKLCADCKRNGRSFRVLSILVLTERHQDPRWASWNLGVFLCIRCSGIHRGMGTHISKVKSVDLDVWTPEQMQVNIRRNASMRSSLISTQSIQKWGNRLANLYWEAHLKPGHVPPEQCAFRRLTLSTLDADRTPAKWNHSFAPSTSHDDGRSTDLRPKIPRC
jgi:hypothetical protein